MRTALHEAGHWTVGAALGYRPTHATVDGDRGRCWFEGPRTWHTLAQIHDNLVFDLAGCIAVAIADVDDDWRDFDLRRLRAVHRLEQMAGQENSRAEVREAIASILRPHEDSDAGAWLRADDWLDDALPDAAAKAARILESRWTATTRIAAVLERDGIYEGGTS